MSCKDINGAPRFTLNQILASRLRGWIEDYRITVYIRHKEQERENRAHSNLEPRASDA